MAPWTSRGQAGPGSSASPGDSSLDHHQPPPDRSPQRGPKLHQRSMSNPFPSLFNSMKKIPGAKSPPREHFGADWGDDDDVVIRESTGKHNRAGPSGSNDFATGNCMVCDSLMRWPNELKVFKCTICTTINDLVPQDRRRDGNQGPARVHHISLGHSRKIVRGCIESYIRQRLCKPPSSDTDDKAPHSGQSHHGGRPGQAMPMRSRGLSDSVQEPNWRLANRQQPIREEAHFVFSEQPTLRPNPLLANSSMPRSYSISHSEKPSIHRPPIDDNSKGSQKRPFVGQQHAPKAIFKKLEDYITDCFRSFECVNQSFYPPRGPVPVPMGAPAITRKPLSQPPPPTTGQPRNLPREALHASGTMYDLDPKMLLLSDVAENGTWWAGGHSDNIRAAASSARNESITRSSSTTKSPEINWEDLRNWYSTVINAAEGWFGIFEEISRESNFANTTEGALQALERDFLEAQGHVQRMLMKVTEILLKRPGRRIKNPFELRFLLILLENPLLHGDAKQFGGLLQPQKEPPTIEKSSSSRDHSVTGSGLLAGQHSGIIKRIVGLMSNSSVECHNQLITWLARYHISRFVQTKDLVSRFITYRMLRQNNKKQDLPVDVTAGLIPELQTGRSNAYLHDEITPSRSSKKTKEPAKMMVFTEDWQIKASSRVLALLFAANNSYNVRRGDRGVQLSKEGQVVAGVRDGIHASDQLLPTSDFYNSMIDYADLVADFESWESKRAKFSFCQYPFLLSIWAKTQILEHDARRQMQNKARDAFFDSIMTHKNVNQYLYLDIRRDCLVDDSLKAVSEVIGSGGEEVKKGLRISFRGEEGIDGGGLRKEWFLLLVREVFNPDYAMFLYDEDSQYCYFNPDAFEISNQFFLVGVVMGLAIYNSTILDVALPPFTFRKLLAAAPAHGVGSSGHQRPAMKYTLNDLAEYRPRLARGLRQLLDYDGDVETTFCLDFVIETDKYGAKVQVPLCPGGERRPVTNQNRREYVELYVRYLLDTAVRKQFDPFKRGFYTVCGGNAFSLFRPEEIELLVRGSDEPVDVNSLRAVAQYDNWGSRNPGETEPIVSWFWETFQEATPSDQRRLLLFITGSDRIPATGASMLNIKISCLGDDSGRYPIARTCFNMLSLWRYETKERLEAVLWRAVHESEGFGLK